MKHSGFWSHHGKFVILVFGFDLTHWSIGIEFWTSRKSKYGFLWAIVVFPLLFGIARLQKEHS